MMIMEKYIKNDPEREHGKFLSSYDCSTVISKAGTETSGWDDLMLKGLSTITGCQESCMYIIKYVHNS